MSHTCIASCNIVSATPLTWLANAVASDTFIDTITKFKFQCTHKGSKHFNRNAASRDNLSLHATWGVAPIFTQSTCYCDETKANIPVVAAWLTNIPNDEVCLFI